LLAKRLFYPLLSPLSNPAKFHGHPLPDLHFSHMHRRLTSFFLVWLTLSAPLSGAREILLRTAPEAGAPAIAKITATDRVILDAAPAGRNAEEGWHQLALPTPFEGYVPTATLDKSLAIVAGTAVHYLPTTESATITEVAPDDRYEVVREQNDWATVRFYKPITGYFLLGPGDDAVRVEIDLQAPRLTPLTPARKAQAVAAPAGPSEATLEPALEPLAIPAPRRPINPDEPISQLDPDSLPPENVVWQPAADRGRASAARNEDQPESNPPPRIPNPESAIMVTPEQTQARETAPAPGPAKPPRLLSGQLIRQIEVDGPGYPIRLYSPDGRLIAFVDLSGIYLPDLNPYLNERVYIRGQIHPLPDSSSQLVIFAESLRLAE
jgi:hypothetical protein